MSCLVRVLKGIKMLRIIRVSALLSLGLVLTLFSTVISANTFTEGLKSKQLTIGAEINPLTFIASTDSRVYFNAGVSIFNRNNSTEIAFPIDYKNIQNGEDQFTALNISAHYRKFLNKDIEGYYFSGATRLTTINSDTTKLGLGFGFGYRKMFNSGLYWGSSILLGRYFGDNDKYDTSSLNSFDTLEDKAVMFDIEFLKIGLMF